MNNPLSFTDPSGYSRLRKGWWRVPVSIAALFIPLPGINGYVAAFIRGALSRGIATDSLKGAVHGGIQATITFGIAHGSGGEGWVKSDTGRMLAHATVGGVSAEVDGGKFGHGFASSYLASGADSIGLTNFSNTFARVIANALVAGTISEVTGGKFSNGAMSAAFRVAFNDLMVRKTKQRAIDDGIKAGKQIRAQINRVRPSDLYYKDIDKYRDHNIGAFVVEKSRWFRDSEFMVRDNLQLFDFSGELEPWNNWIGTGNLFSRGFSGINTGDIRAILINSALENRMPDSQDALYMSLQVKNAPVYITLQNNENDVTYEVISSGEYGMGTCTVYSGKDNLGFCN